jgi:type II secretory pathway pseudopilin PulG
MQATPPPMPMQAPPAPVKSGMSPLAIVLICVGIFFFLIILVAAIAGMVAPMVIQQRKKAEMSMTISNARAAGLALMEFEMEYGRFPDAETAAAVAENTRSNLAIPGTSANDHLRQLIAAGIAPNEPVFYAKTDFTHEPDNAMDTPDTALAPGECGFGYVMNGETGLTTSIHPSAPVLCAPLVWDFDSVSGTNFDPYLYDRRVVLLHIDMSVRPHRLNSTTGQVMLEGHPWLATGEGTVWGTEIKPRVAVPEAK